MELRFVVHVHLFEPHDGQDDFYFGSMAAIYDVLPASAVGIKYDVLANCFAKNGHCLATGKCIIKRGVIYRKKQRNKTE